MATSACDFQIMNFISRHLEQVPIKVGLNNLLVLIKSILRVNLPLQNWLESLLISTTAIHTVKVSQWRKIYKTYIRLMLGRLGRILDLLYY
jgi:hypothetical protein